MKPFREMDETEQQQFLDQLMRVLTIVQSNIPPPARPGAIVVCCKCLDRTLWNVWTEWGLDQDLFLKDAIEQTQQFLKNLIDVASMPAEAAFRGADRLTPDERRGVIETAARVAAKTSQTIAHPVYREMLVALFEELFDRARKEGDI